MTGPDARDERPPSRVVIGGDVCLGSTGWGHLGQQRVVRVEADSGLARLLRSANLVIANLECPVTSASTKIAKGGHNLKAADEVGGTLADLGIDLVTLANNHVMDYGRDGLADTLAALERAGVGAVGAGLNRREARKAHVVALDGCTLAVVNMAEAEAGCVGREGVGVHTFDLIGAVEAIREARASADHVVFVLHAGLESSHYPSPESVRTLRFLAEEGVTAIVRHHPHCVQGHESWKGVPIFYSVGNFLLDWPDELMGEGWTEGILVELLLRPTGPCGFEVHPFAVSSGEARRPELLYGEDRDVFMARFAAWGRVLADQNELWRRWAGTIAARARSYLAVLALPHPWFVAPARRLGLSALCRPGRTKRMILETYLRSESHREALLAALDEAKGVRND